MMETSKEVASVDRPDRDPEVQGGSGLASLLILLHVICVVVALSSNVHRSSLQARLVGILEPYLGLANLDPDFTPYHLTHAEVLDDDHFVEVEVLPATGTDRMDPNGNVTVLEGDNRWGFNSRRYRRLAYVMAYHAQQENDHLAATLARAVANLVLKREEGSRAIVRCRQHESQPRQLDDLVPGFPDDPADARYQHSVYEADVWWVDGTWQVQKRVTDRETARVNLEDRLP